MAGDDKDLPQPLRAEELPEHLDELMPRTDSDSYTPFNNELDEKLPVEKLFSKENLDAVAQGSQGIKWISLLRNSPIQNSEAEIIMGKFVTAAARTGQWVDIPIQKDEPIGNDKLDFGGVAIDFSGLMFKFGRGAQLLADKKWIAKVEDDDGKEWLKPQEPMLNFLKEKLKRFGPQEKTE